MNILSRDQQIAIIACLTRGWEDTCTAAGYSIEEATRWIEREVEFYDFPCHAGACASGAGIMPEADFVPVQSFDPWIIGYAAPQSEHIAKASLEREGFEVWYPIRKIVTTRPQRSLPSKTRHRRRHEVLERLMPVLSGYLFIRRLTGNYDLGLLRELAGVNGLCRFGEIIATLADFEIEILRLAEADGRYNSYDAAVPNTHRVWSADPRMTDEKASPHLRSRWSGAQAPNGRFDKIGKSAHFVEEFGRVLRFVKSIQQPATP